jgi:hypothetical protein
VTETDHYDSSGPAPVATEITVEGNRTIVHSLAPGETVVIEAHTSDVGPDNDDNDTL